MTTVVDKKGIIEFQAFRGNNNEFIIKELVFLDLQTLVVFPFLFKPPFSFNKLTNKAKKTNKWLMRNFHHIEWCDGFTTYNSLESVMQHFCSEFTSIYTRGLEKCNWVQKYSPGQVYDITLNKNFQLGNHEQICILKKNKQHRTSQCALKNAYRLAAFLKPVAETSSGGSGGYIYQEVPQSWHEYYWSLW